MKYKRFAILSTDTKAGGISTMLGVHTVALVSLGYNVSVILPKMSVASKNLDYIASDEKIQKYFTKITFNKWQLYAVKLGLSKWLLRSLSNVDGCFVHNARLIPLIKNIISLPVFAINHTGKESQNIYFLKADLVFSINKNMKNQLIKFGLESSKSILCPNAILNLPNANLTKNKTQIPMIGAIGRMVEKKGFFDFINALKILKLKGIEFKAQIAGDGEQFNKLKQCAKDLPELKFLGWVKNKENFYNNLDIFCQPSLFEPFGLTLIEAMSMSCPVISTNCDGPRDIISSGKNGFLVSKGDPEELALTMIKLLKDKSLRVKMGSQGRDYVEKNYIVKNLSQILQRHISNYYS